SLANFLFEVFHRNVLPYIPTEVDENCIDSAQPVKHRRQMIVVFDLRSRKTSAKAKALAEFFTERMTVDIGISYVVGIHVAGSSAELRGIGNSLQQGQLAPNPRVEHFDFLTESGWRGGLTVCAGEHRDVAPLMGKTIQGCYYVVEHREKLLLHKLL